MPNINLEKVDPFVVALLTFIALTALVMLVVYLYDEFRHHHWWGRVEEYPCHFVLICTGCGKQGHRFEEHKWVVDT